MAIVDKDLEMNARRLFDKDGTIYDRQRNKESVAI